MAQIDKDFGINADISEMRRLADEIFDACAQLPLEHVIAVLSKTPGSLHDFVTERRS